MMTGTGSIPVIQRIVDMPWMFVGTVLCIVLLNVAAAIRLRRDNRLKTRAPLDRRSQPRAEPDRRWSVERLKK